MSRARPITRDDLLRRYAAAMDIDASTLQARAECVTDEELRDLVETAEGRRAGQREAFRAGRTTTVDGITR